jgi:hypothetical protein
MNVTRNPNENDLIDLLRGADADAPSPVLPLAEDLAAAAREAAAARDRLYRGVGGSALVVALVATVAFGVARSDLQRRRTSDSDRVRLMSELSLLSRQAETQQRSADRMSETLQRRKQTQQRAQVLQKPTAPQQLSIESDRTAMTMLLDAQERESKSKSRKASASAMKQYRKIVDLFPDSPAADMARKRLASDRPEGKEPVHTYPGSM